MRNFRNALGLAEHESPFPWQEELLARFIDEIGKRSSLDIPTGLGKTSVIAAWLVARSQGAALPRRLVYIVDRRAVVDQATREAEKLRSWVDSSPNVKSQLGLASDQSLPISTLRGQYVDNREWLEDPSAPAIIVGTVDMIGSRLLFEGYGVSRKMRPYHAGLLGADTLFVLDEAHLVPPFEMMLQTLVMNDTGFGPDHDLARLIPDFKLLSLSATGRSAEGEVWRLTEADLRHPVAKKRLEATKRLSFCESDGSKSLSELLAEEAWSLADREAKAVRVIVFSNSRDVAKKAKEAIEQLTGDTKQGINSMTIETELFVGARRVREREQAAEWLDAHGFLAGSEKAPQHPTFLFATSAGEVGVDLDADHMVCDLVEWERMVQRLGRVNRRGDGDAIVRVIVEWPSPDGPTQKAIAKLEAKRTKAEQAKVALFRTYRHRVETLRQAVVTLPQHGDWYDASPGAIRDPIATMLAPISDPGLKRMMFIGTGMAPDPRPLIAAATSPTPLRPALTRPIVEAWSMTSLEKHTGRPAVAPWLRGWVDDDPQTTVIWRRYLPVCENSSAAAKKQFADAAEFFEQAPPHLSETLETESRRVFDWLTKRAKTILKKMDNELPIGDDSDQSPQLQRDSIIGFVLGRALSVERFVSLEELAFEGDKKAVDRRKDELQRSLNNNTLVIDARFGGLSENGLLDDATKFKHSSTGDDEDWGLTGFRVRLSEDGSRSDDRIWRTCFRFVSRLSELGEPLSWLLVEKRRVSTTSEDARAITKTNQALSTHQEWAEREAKRLAKVLNLSPEYEQMLKVAARSHDEGKQSLRWQNTFSAPAEGRPFAKTRGPVKPRLLDGYRHEFGSLPYLERDPEFLSLSPDLQDLALHLVSAHHGFARPVIRTTGCEDAPPSALEHRAREVALRFARLQRRWGPWGLAWWESLLRAADQRASRLLDESPTNQETNDNQEGGHVDG
ncbi:type I-G CRISPR-associated helicase/endonuclease Cas3g [Gimesia panareensis]|uniref:type I-G CRISPR-associated helicase/endonuclease Cas3g n=1 Tax=Gimesia panareensis TaxID=2527978 RepID=UPI0018D8714D|nr:type I-U CRISPR-associated helicase/endonuclease Cas3 [Gimesia panareensis]